MDNFARLFFWGYTLMLIGIGASGMLVASWELSMVFGVDLNAMGEPQRATLINQYRFLKALELAFGAFCLSFRYEIFSRPRELRVFLFGLFAGVAGRLGSCIADGTPRPVFLAFMVLELLTGVLVWLAFRRRSVA